MDKTEEARLQDALYALNRAFDPELDDPREARVVTLVRIRDEVWALGQELYGWTDW